MRLAAFIFVTLGAFAQTAIVPSSILCPPPQIMIAVPSSTLGISTILRLTCATIDPSITIDKTVAPWTLKPSTVIGGQTINFAGNETPVGVLDGNNAAFTLAHAPAGGTLLLFRNGLKQTAGQDFAISGQTVTFAPVAPGAGDVLSCSYFF